MKTLCVIDAFPSTPKKAAELQDCVRSLKITGLDILVTSHFPVEATLQREVNYVIFDHNNLLLPSFVRHWTYTDRFHVDWWLPYHGPAICLNWFNAFNFAKNHDYEFIVYISSDCIFSNEDSHKLMELVRNCETSNTKGFIFNPQNWKVETCFDSEMGFYLWETLMFGFSVDTFLTCFDPPKNLNLYRQLSCPEKSLETNFFYRLQPLKNEINILPSSAKEYFKDSQIDLSGQNLFYWDLMHNKSNPGGFIFFVQSFMSASDFCVKLFVNDLLILNQNFQDGVWYYKDFYQTEENLRAELWIENELKATKNYSLNGDLLAEVTQRKDFFEFLT